MKEKIVSTLIMIATMAAISIASASSITAQPVKAIKNVRPIITGRILWSKDYGVIPLGPKYSEASPNPCGPFYVAATVPSTGKAVAISSEMTLDNAVYYRPSYICNFTIQNVPVDTPLYVIAGMGGILLLPKMSEDPYYWTDAWVGGDHNKPPPGTFRTFTGSQSVRLTNANPKAVVYFELIYARKDNPK